MVVQARTASLAAVSLLVLVASLSLSASGAEWQYGTCPRGYDCVKTPHDGRSFPPPLVTGHTVYANYTLTAGYASSPLPYPVLLPGPLPLPRETPAVQTSTSFSAGLKSLHQAECVTWVQGHNLDARPSTEAISWDGGTDNHFFSDMDEPRSSDEAYQDYDPGRVLSSCLPEDADHPASDPPLGHPTDFAALSGFFSITSGGWWTPSVTEYGTYAVAVEAGDCSPSAGAQFHFRGHLDFVDPNDIYHEVQEFEYSCNKIAGVANPSVSDVVRDLFPPTWTDPHGWDGCDRYALPPESDHFDLGHKCNGSIQDLFTERMWMTPVHAPVYDASVQAQYTYAIVVDTCSGWNIAEVDLLRAGPLTGYELEEFDRLLDGGGPVGLDLGLPRTELCHDGSSFSFDDTSRGRTLHDAWPATIEEIMRGNALDYDPSSDTWGKHRTNCRQTGLDWPYNDPPWAQDSCHGEDHKTASIDVYIFDHDVTGGLFLTNSNGLTGQNDYNGSGTPSGADTSSL